MSRKVSARSLFFHITALALALIVPALVFSGVVTKRWVASEEARLGTTAREQNDRALVQIERYLAGQIAMLQALATSPALESRDFKRFDQQARELFELQGVNIVLRDRTGQQWINTRLPWGAALPRTDLEADQVVFRTRQPSVSDLFASATSGALVAVAIVPVLRQGEVDYLLSAAIPPQVVADLLRKTGVADPYSAFVTDRTGRMIALVPRPDHEAGEPFRELAGTTGAARGLPGTSPDEAIAFASQTSDLSGWNVSVGVRTDALQAPLARSLWMLGGLAALLAAIGTAISCLVVRRLLRSQQQIAAAIAALRDREVVEAPVTPVLETNQVGEALAETSVRLLAQTTALEWRKHTLEACVEQRTRALAESERRYRLLAEHANDMVVRADRDTTRRYVSPASRELLGYEPAELVGTRPVDFTHPDDRDGLRRILDDLTSGRTALAVSTHRLRRKDGGYVWVEAKFRPVRDDAGQPTGYVAAVRDISERKAAEQALRESEARYRLLADNASDIIMVREIGGPRTYVSPACLSMLGYTHDEFIALPTTALVHPDDYASVIAAYESISLERPRLTHLHRLKHKLGHWVWVEAAFRLLDGREPATVLVAIRDVSERQRQSEELRLAKEAAEQASQAKTEFLAAMSHEIRTPLNAILGFTSLLCEANHFKPDDRRKLDVIHSSGAALLTIVDDILDFSKVEAGRIELNLRSFALPRLVEQVLAIACGVAAAKDLDIRSEIDPCVPHRIVGDPGRLRQVLLNLLNNAVKFTPRGSVTLSLRCEDSTGPDARLRFTITDTGIGIAKEHQARLFQRFSQAHGSIQRDFGGTGLGLAIAKRLIGLMGGVIGLESAPGQGSTFWFTLRLPVASEPAAAVQPMRTEQPLAPPSARILLVEDVDINQELARAVLTGAGYAVETASNGAEAVMAVQNGVYDVVLMDVQMPVMDGIAATERIRNLSGPQRHVPIIAMTANVLPEHVGRLKAAGMDDHIGKPFQKRALLDAILKWRSREADAADQRSGGQAEAA